MRLPLSVKIVKIIINNCYGRRVLIFIDISCRTETQLKYRLLDKIVRVLGFPAMFITTFTSLP